MTSCKQLTKDWMQRSGDKAGSNARALTRTLNLRTQRRKSVRDWQTYSRAVVDQGSTLSADMKLRSRELINWGPKINDTSRAKAGREKKMFDDEYLKIKVNMLCARIAVYSKIDLFILIKASITISLSSYNAIVDLTCGARCLRWSRMKVTYIQRIASSAASSMLSQHLKDRRPRSFPPSLFSFTSIIK